MTVPDIRVLVADDQTIVREGLVTVLDLAKGVEVVAQARDGQEAIDLTLSARPDVVLTDLRMPGMDGVAAIRAIRAELPQQAIIVLTTYDDDRSIAGALRAGALGFLTKDAGRAEIVRAIHAAAAGQSVLAPGVVSRLAASFGDASDSNNPVATSQQASTERLDTADHRTGAESASHADTAMLSTLTPRELEVLRLIADGYANADISKRLFVGTATVKTHINNLFAKLGVSERSEAIRAGRRLLRR